MTKTLAFAVRFANFAMEYSLYPNVLAKLIELAKASKSAYERNDNRKHLAKMAEFDALAMGNGFETDWPGLWPTLRKNGYDIHLPCE